MATRILIAGGRLLSDGGPQRQHADMLIDGETIVAVEPPHSRVDRFGLQYGLGTPIGGL